MGRKKKEIVNPVMPIDGKKEPEKIAAPEIKQTTTSSYIDCHRPTSADAKAEEIARIQPQPKRLPIDGVIFVGTGCHLINVPVKKTVIENGNIIEKVIFEKKDIKFNEHEGFSKKVTDPEMIKALREKGFREVE